MRFRMFVGGMGALVVATSLPAQRILGSLDVSGTGVWYADSIHAAGSSISPAVRLDWPSVTVSAFGNLSRVDGGVSAQGSLAPSLFTPTFGPFSGEVAATLGGSTRPDKTRTGQTLGIVRLYANRSGAGIWGGGGVGASWDGTARHTVRQTEAGAWALAHGVTTLATVTPVVVADSIRYTDFQAAFRYPTSRFELGVSVGARSGSVGEAIGGSSRAWGSASGTMWLSSSFAIVGSAGSYPVDLTQGYPGGRFISLALRIASRNSRNSRDSGVAEPEQDADSSTTPAVQLPPSAIANFDVAPVGESRRLVRLDASAKQTVEINGDFTQWQPVSLVRGANGSWSVVLSIPNGTHQFNVRVDGGSWIVPPGVLTTKDEFGGVVGILTVE